MKKSIIFSILICCVSAMNAQMKFQREYDYVGSEANGAGLRIVGIKEHIRDKYYYNEVYIDGYGCIDKSGNEIVPLIYAEIKISKEWDFIVVKKLNISKNRVDEYDYGILSEDGQKTITPIKYKQISNIKLKPNTKEMQYAIVKTHKGLYGFINNRGEEIVPPIYTEIEQMDLDYYKVQQNGKWGVLIYKGGTNNNFEEIVQPIYDEFRQIYKDYYVIQQNGQYGLALFRRGTVSRFEVVVTPKYHGKMILIDEYNGYFAVALNGNWGIIDYKGKELVPPQYGDIYGKNGVAVVYKENKYGVIDMMNNVIVPFEYDRILSFNGWSMWAEKEIRGKSYYTLLDRNGNVLLPSNNYGKKADVRGGRWSKIYLFYSLKICLLC